MNDRHDDERFGELVADSIARRATSISARPNEAALFARVGARAARQRRVLVAAAVVAVAVASVTGYAIGTTNTEGDDSVQTPVAGPSDPSVSTSPVDGAEPANEGPLEHVFTRTVNGVTVRVYTTPPTGEPSASPGFVVAEMSNDAAVGIGRAENCPAMGLRASGTFGGPEGSPVEWVIVQSFDPPTTAGASVRAQFGGGADEMVPVRGIAVLVAPGEGGTVSVSGADVHTEVPSASPVGQVIETDEAMCQPPATLPPAGPQPADVAAAEAGVREAYTVAYTTGTYTEEEGWAAIEDGDQFSSPALRERVRQAARDAGRTDAEIDNMTVETGEIRFTDETHAAVLFQLTIPGPASGPWRLGYAVLQDGRWKVARETRCDDLRRINVECP